MPIMRLWMLCSPAVFRLRKDPQGAAALKKNFGTGFAHMITTMWQLDIVDTDAVSDSGVHGQAGFGSEMFSHGFFTGIIDFAKEYATLVEFEYLAGYQEAVAKCNVRFSARLLFFRRQKASFILGSWFLFCFAVARLYTGTNHLAFTDKAHCKFIS